MYVCSMVRAYGGGGGGGGGLRGRVRGEDMKAKSGKNECYVLKTD